MLEKLSKRVIEGLEVGPKPYEVRDSQLKGNVPELKAADQAFADLSKPINQMQIGQQLSSKLIPALGDFGGNASLRAGQYAAALRNGDQLAANATGWKGSTLANTLAPDQMATVNQIAQQLARTANANATGVVGSNTGQNLIGQNVVRQFLGPLGLPQSTVGRAAASTLMQQISKPLQWVGNYGEENIRGLLSRAMLDPQFAASLLQTARPNPATAYGLGPRLLGATSLTGTKIPSLRPQPTHKMPGLPQYSRPNDAYHDLPPP